MYLFCNVPLLTGQSQSLHRIVVVLSCLILSANQQQCDSSQNAECEQSVDSSAPHFSRYKEPLGVTRYLLYDVNFNEGFNLRRDVYMRMATLVKSLGPNWVLVLPPWSHLPHWQLTPEQEPKSKCWSTYFDIELMNQFVNVIEMEDFLRLYNGSKVPIDSLLALEHSESFHDTEFTEMYEINESVRTRNYQNLNGIVSNLADPLMNDKLEYKRLYEIKIEGFDSTMAKLIEKHFAHSATVLVSNAEIILHSNYGDRQYWMSRMSMRFASNLRKEGDRYRAAFLNSSDIVDGTELPLDWSSLPSGVAKGGPYVAVHFRRGDFRLYRANRVPDIDCALQQIHFVASNLLNEQIDHIYISTDADENEWKQLKAGLELKKHKVFNYQRDTKSKLLDGEVAIIDQYIASHAHIFVGSLESTFSYQIQEEREIMGFKSSSTFNALCSKCDLRLMLKICHQESTWKIK